jgi:DNA mismatch endonuclease (patch repair protein)
MTDNLTPGKRSELMSRIRSSNTKPELTVRSILHRNGYRYSLKRKNLPGKPDIVLVRYNIAVFVHGCFWHQHAGCQFSFMPKTRIEYWGKKLQNNADRDKRIVAALKKLGWQVLIVWECEIKNPSLILERVTQIIEAIKK